MQTRKLVIAVQESAEWLQRKGDQGGEEGYAEAVDEIAEGTQEVADAWKKVLEYVEEWAPIAHAVLEGLGEEGSLMPT